MAKKKTVAITKKPTGKVSGLCAPKRDASTYTFRVSWGVPASLTDTSNKARAEGFEIQWVLGLGWKKNPASAIKKVGTGTKAASVNLNSKVKFGSKGWERTSFYPDVNKTNYRLGNLHCYVRAYNRKGKGPWVHVYRPLEAPRNPSIAQPSQNETSGVVSARITQDRGLKDYKECRHTYYWVKVKDTSVSNKWVTTSSGKTTSTDFNTSYNATNRYKLTYDQVIAIEFSAQARGLRGNSGTVKRMLYISYPREPGLKGYSVANKNPSTKLTCTVNTNRNTEHPVTGCRLQKLRNSTATTAAAAMASDGWADTDIEDDGNCSALALAVEDVLPEAGKTTWVRVKTWNQFEDKFYRLSQPLRLTKLETPVPTAADDEIVGISLTPGEDGKSLVATLGWNEDGKDDSTGTELTWSTNENAWRSTEAPSTYEFTWSDGKLVDGSHTYNDSAVVHLDGLDEGTQYWVKARRYLVGDEGTTYGAYTDPMTALTTSTPPSVTMVAPPFIARGTSLPLSWTFSTDSPQTKWQVLCGTLVESENVDEDSGSAERTTSLADAVIVQEGTDALGSCVLDAQRVAGLARITDEAGNVTGTKTSLAFAVRISTGGGFIESEAHAVRIADAPTFLLAVPNQYTAQGAAFAATCSSLSSVSLVITAQGAEGARPGGTRQQVAGDTIFSRVYGAPTWTAGDDGTFSTTLQLDDALDLWDGATYTVRATATDNETGLVSAEAEAEFTVAWAHQAPAPNEDIEVVATDTTDADGIRTRSASIELLAPEGAETTDVYDVYRLTPDGAYLIAEGVAQGTTITDPLAPYGGSEKGYRIACRTADGDVDWLDYEYELAGEDLRIDFGNQYVELPFDLEIQDAFEKDFETRAHLGQATPQGYWNETVTRKASFSTDVVRSRDDALLADLRTLAQYDGPVFVRTPDGCAYQANVDVNGLDTSISSPFVSVGLDGVEVGLTSEYMAEVPIADDGSLDNTEPEGEGA